MLDFFSANGQMMSSRGSIKQDPKDSKKQKGQAEATRTGNDTDE